jgi:hypothetical protein
MAIPISVIHPTKRGGTLTVIPAGHNRQYFLSPTIKAFQKERFLLRARKPGFVSENLSFSLSS